MKARTLAVLAAAVLSLIIGASVGPANASDLGVDGPQAHTSTAHACSTATISVTQTPTGIVGWFWGYDGIRFTVPANCAGHDLDVTVYATSGGAVLGHAHVNDVPAGTFSTTFSGAAFNGLLGTPAAVATTFDGWQVPASF